MLAETDLSWQLRGPYSLTLQVVGTRILALIDGNEIFDVRDSFNRLTGVGTALICEQGRVSAGSVYVSPATAD